MPIVAETYTYVVGVDTHAATHQYAILEAGTGGLLDQQEFPTHTAGLARAADWIGRRTSGQVASTLISAEGTGSYGSRLTVLLAETGYRVVDAPAPKRTRGSGKNDQIDAVLAARGTLYRESTELADARAGQTRAALQVLLTARESMTGERTRAINALNAVLRVHDLGIDARRKVSRPTIRTIGAWRTRVEPLAAATARAETIRLARRILALDEEVDTNTGQLRGLVADLAPTMLELPGVGPVNASVVLAAWSHPGRVRSDAAFAKLGGVCPLEVSSGQRTEHRLNRSGDRQLNRALHSIASSRMIHHEPTRAYVAEHTSNGMTKPRIRRCLKRYIARQLHRELTRVMA